MSEYLRCVTRNSKGRPGTAYHYSTDGERSLCQVEKAGTVTLELSTGQPRLPLCKNCKSLAKAAESPAPSVTQRWHQAQREVLDRSIKEGQESAHTAHQVRVKIEFSVAWALIIGGGAAMDLAGLHPERWYWWVWAIALAVVEIWAVKLVREGNTLSENTYRWSSSKIARRIQTGVFASWLVWHVYALSAAPMPGEPWTTGLGSILAVASFAVWIVPHFLFEGDHG